MTRTPVPFSEVKIGERFVDASPSLLTSPGVVFTRTELKHGGGHLTNATGSDGLAYHFGPGWQVFVLAPEAPAPS